MCSEATTLESSGGYGGARSRRLGDCVVQCNVIQAKLVVVGLVRITAVIRVQYSGSLGGRVGGRRARFQHGGGWVCLRKQEEEGEKE